MSPSHTPGPWKWVIDTKSKRLALRGAVRCTPVMEFARWGTSSATAMLRDTERHGCGLLYRVHERPDWIAPEPGREHHKDWHQLLTHPDACLIESAPELLATLKRLRMALDPDDWCGDERMIDVIDATIAKAEGGGTP